MYNTLLRKIDSTINIPLRLEKNMNVEQLSSDQLCMAHVRLHNLYPRGNGTLSKENIEQLHSKIKEKINHKIFDQLDKKNE